jgi:hypothetical protein
MLFLRPFDLVCYPCLSCCVFLSVNVFFSSCVIVSSPFTCHCALCSELTPPPLPLPSHPQWPHLTDELIAKAVPTIVQILNGVRIVSVGGMDCPCGGTHIRDTSELGKVTVEKVVAKGKVTRVSYSLEG